MPDRRRLPSRFELPTPSNERFGELEPFLWRMAALGCLILGLFAFGTVGFVLTEDVSIWHGFNWTLDTIATVGSIPDPENTGAQVLKVLLEILGIGTLFYALVTVTEFFVAGHLGDILRRRRVERMIRSLKDHHLICGFGRVGRQVARDLVEAGDSFVVIDALPENREIAESMRAPFIEGKPSDDDSLRRAGLDRARSVLACVDSDAENIFITLTARELRPDITIVARASVEDSEKKLLRAGANRVISPYKASGAEMARLALHPQVPVAVDVTPEYRVEEIEVSRDCAGAGRTVEDVRGDSVVVALRRGDGEMELQPPADRVVEAGDVVVAMGDDEAMDALEDEFAPAGATVPVR